MGDTSPCLSCGACCAFFRVSFYWAELASAGGQVPDSHADPLPPHRAVMRGTHSATPRCAALQGRVGEAVCCSIYENRPSPCREFTSSVEVPGGAPDCERARRAVGLPPLVVIPANDDFLDVREIC